MYDLEKFEKSMIEEGIAEGTIHTYICHIKEYFDWLLGSGEVEFKRLYRQNILEYISYLKNIKKTDYNLNSALNYNEEGTGTFILNALKIAL